MRLSSLKAALWFGGAMAVALAFPLQVYADSPLPSLLPYAAIVGVFAVNWLSAPGTVPAQRGGSGTMRRIVGVYAVVVAVTTAWQAGLGLIDASAAVSAIVVFALPVAFYMYFRRKATTKEVTAFLAGIAAAGLIIGLFFAYDSFLRLGVGRVSDFSRAAFEYSLARSGESAADANPARILPWARSYGLLEKHSVSGAWVVIGAFAALALIPFRTRGARRAVIWAAGGMLLIGLNFTAMVAFAIIAFILEFGGTLLVRGRLSTATIYNAAGLVVIAVVIGVVVVSVVDENVTLLVVSIALGQRDLAFGSSDPSASYIGIVGRYVSGYFAHIGDMPFTFLFGDGYGPYGALKGGDIGIVETLERFGLPLFSVIVAGVLALLRSGLRRLASPLEASDLEGTIPNDRGLTEFAVAVLMLMVIMDGHYSVWSAKAILPIVFFALALFDRRSAAEAVTNGRREPLRQDSGLAPMLSSEPLPS